MFNKFEYLEQLQNEAKYLESLHESEITKNQQFRLNQIALEIEVEQISLQLYDQIFYDRQKVNIWILNRLYTWC